MKNAKFLSPLRFYRDLILKRNHSAMKEMDSNRDIVLFTPILSLLLVNILLLIVLQNAVALMALVFSILLIASHAITFSQVNKWLIQEKEFIRKENEARRKEAEREERIRRHREYIERLYREEMERLERMRKRRQEREEARRKAEYANQQNTVDQNIINAMKLLGLQKGFTVKDLKSAYRKLSKVHHPDAGGLEANFKKLNTAYNYLMERM